MRYLYWILFLVSVSSVHAQVPCMPENKGKMICDNDRMFVLICVLVGSPIKIVNGKHTTNDNWNWVHMTVDEKPSRTPWKLDDVARCPQSNGLQKK
jgi:hypothetical protein